MVITEPGGSWETGLGNTEGTGTGSVGVIELVVFVAVAVMREGDGEGVKGIEVALAFGAQAFKVEIASRSHKVKRFNIVFSSKREFPLGGV